MIVKIYPKKELAISFGWWNGVPVATTQIKHSPSKRKEACWFKFTSRA